MHLNNVFIRVFTAASLSISRCYKAPSAVATVVQWSRPEVGGLSPRKETGHLLFPYSDMKRHFYFCRPPRTAASPLFLPSSKLSRGNINAHVRGDLQYGYRSYLQRISSSSFSATRRFPAPIFRIPLPNRPARDSSKSHSIGLESSRLTVSPFLRVLLRGDSYLPITSLSSRFIFDAANAAEAFQGQLTILRVFITLRSTNNGKF